MIFMTLVATAVMSAPTAMAQNAACLSLTNELAALDSRGGFVVAKDSRYKEYERAVRDQRAQIAKTQRLARKSGCAQRASSSCTRIEARLAEMTANLEQLERTMARMGPPKKDERRRRAILADMQAFGCQDRRTAEPDIQERSAGIRQEAPRRRTLLEQIFGVRTFTDDGMTAEPEYEGDETLTQRYGTFRTLCVRSCDGYYFPISFSTRRDFFEQDEQACTQMCPAAEVALYYHAMPSQDSEDMVSYRGDEPYASLPNAFSYRKAVNPDCTCGVSRPSGLTEVAGSQSFRIQQVQPPQPATPLPSRRPDPGLDPEALANAAGLFGIADIEVMARRSQSPQANSQSTGNRTVRIVGPAFFPAQ
jgi:hypothetical protein